MAKWREPSPWAHTHLRAQPPLGRRQRHDPGSSCHLHGPGVYQLLVRPRTALRECGSLPAHHVGSGVDPQVLVRYLRREEGGQP